MLAGFEPVLHLCFGKPAQADPEVRTKERKYHCDASRTPKPNEANDAEQKKTLTESLHQQYTLFGGNFVFGFRGA